MSEVWEAQAESGSAAVADAPDDLTAGALLRRAREAAGLHVAALAVSLKVPVRKVEALEGDRHDLLTDAVFVRALASSVCRALKIDPQPILERLPQMAAPRLTRRSESLNEPFRAPSDGAPPTWLDQLSRPVFLAVFALLLGALVLISLPRMQDDSPAAVATSPAMSLSTAVPAPPVASVPPATEASTAVVSPAAAAASAPAAVASAAKPSASSAAAMPVAAGAVAAVVATAASGLVVFRTKSPSWVEVTDAKGVVSVSKVLGAGEAAAASGALPLRVTIGRVDATEVHVRGKRFDLSSVSRDNVARFEIK